MTDESKTYTLLPEQEFRLEVDFASTAIVQLKSGTAEIFGAELAPATIYSFSGQKVAIFSWHGCTLEIQGACSVQYVAEETPMHSYLNLHTALAQQRTAATASQGSGPVVLVLGPTDAGKSSLSKILLNYAVRQQHHPIFVNLDPAEGSIAMPGTLSAAPMLHLVDPVDEFSAIGLDKTGEMAAPLCFHYGFAASGDNPKLFRLLITKLASAVHARLKHDTASRQAGLIIDTGGTIDPNSYDIIKECVDVFNVTAIVILGHERLYSDMNRLYTNSSAISVVKLAKSGGVVNRDKDYLRQAQQRAIKKYFYGSAQCEYSPFSAIAWYQDLKIYRVEDSIAPTSALPLGLDRKVSETQTVPMDPGPILLHSILTVSSLDSTEDESKILESSAIGFVYVSAVNERKSTITVLSPIPGRLPRKYLLLSSFKWMEM
ncbi:Cleavage polyadenylation factor subunit clp1 [Dimargaris verticillata]|uniref:Polynucleotide 5'-hydroxyl-kinase GRC3 n=1 Tax=Dimargaris verticillata TaxID=2761393 RepID=A0A9W8BAU7_9FUNG|nr:Cleavage polyadenylation factor subunit clp1 [Dimargaris verticillata]